MALHPQLRECMQCAIRGTAALRGAARHRCLELGSGALPADDHRGAVCSASMARCMQSAATNVPVHILSSKRARMYEDTVNMLYDMPFMQRIDSGDTQPLVNCGPGLDILKPPGDGR